MNEVERLIKFVLVLERFIMSLFGFACIAFWDDDLTEKAER
jgi:hypothetical protein